MDDKRQDPDKILEEINKEETAAGKSGRGKLKIFLGYSAGVGKTYRMLQETLLSRKNGVDAVVGLAETHGRKETEALLEGLEIIPRKKVEYAGLTLEEMDTDALLARKPALAAVDELAHTNAPGSRHTWRYQDVEELLNAGIDVFTTLNIQHIESLNDVVAQISGINVAERVPDGIIELAGEVELVDLTPEKLIERFREGKVYFPRKAEQAMRQFFKKSNLLALRELSLRYTARHVDEDIRTFREKNAVSGPWPVGSRLLVGISASPTSEKLLRFTHRMAVDLDEEWFAVYVESPQKVRADANARARIQLEKNIRLAENLGAKVVLLTGDSVAGEILNFAKANNVSLIIAGTSRRTRLERIIRGAIVDELIRKGGSINVLVTSIEKDGKPASGRYNPLFRPDFRAYLYSFFAILAFVGIGALLRPKVEPVNIGILLLLPAVASGILWGIRVGLFASVVTVCAFDFFFVPPLYTFAVSDIKYLPSFLFFTVVSVAISFLTKSIRKEIKSSRNRERFAYSLYSFSRDIVAAKGLDEIVTRAVNNIGSAFESGAVIFLGESSGKLVLKARNRENISLSEKEQAVAAWAYNNGQAAGKNTNTLSSAQWRYLPLKVQDNILGVIGIMPFDREKFLTPDQEQLFKSFASIVALAITSIP